MATKVLITQTISKCRVSPRKRVKLPAYVSMFPWPCVQEKNVT